MEVEPQLASEGTEKQWRTRLERVSELRVRCAPAATILDFYAVVLQFQHHVASTTTRKMLSDSPFREQIDLNLAAEQMPKLLSLTIDHGPKLLSERAMQSQASGAAEWRALLQSAIAVDGSSPDETGVFFARACLQPIAENLQLQIPEDSNYTGSACPICQAPPQLSLLRPEGEGARRSLLCSLCLREWVFRRVVCPHCGEEDKEKLPHYSAEEFPHVRVEACDTCKRYLKAVDLSIDGHAVPLVDEVALAALDVWTAERGYTKISANLMGF